MKLRSPAKVNLRLQVLSKRPDGYHELHTVFERISLFDEITLSPAAAGIRILTSSRNIPRGPKNLAWRAAKLLQDTCRTKRGVVIRIRKRIPVEAGLGGGSSNAAAVLVGLNRMWKLGLDLGTLVKLGASLGSDVPFFVLGTPFALGRGRGEKLEKLRLPGLKLWHCVVKPPFGLSTRKAYSALVLSGLTPPRPDVKMLLHSIQKGRWDSLSKLLFNSLEVVSNKRLIKIQKLKSQLLRQGARGALMSGSGSAVFGVFPSRKTAESAARKMKSIDRRFKVFTVSTY